MAYEQLSVKRYFFEFADSATVTRRLALLVVLIILAVWISVYLLLTILRRDAINDELRQNSNVARVLQEQTVRVLSVVDQALCQLRAASARGAVAEAEYARIATATGLPSDVLLNISLFDLQGHIRGSSDPEIIERSRDKSFAGRDYIAVHLAPAGPASVTEDMTNEGFFIGRPIFSRLGGRPLIPVSQKLETRTGSAAGVAVAFINPDYFANLYKEVRLGERGGVSMVGHDSAVRVRVLGGKVVNTAVSVASNAPIRQGALGVEGTMVGKSYLNQQPRIAAYHKVGKYPLYIFVVSSTDEILAAWRHLCWLVTLLAALFSASVVAAAVSYQISLRRLQEKNEILRSQGAEDRAANQSKTDFLAAMSHELRTPLTSILGFSELIEHRSAEPKVRQQAALIRSASEHLNKLLTEILDLAKVEAGAIVYHRDAIRVDELVASVAEFFQVSAAQKGLELLVEPAQYSSGALESDALRLRQILNNLLSNAIKFTPTGSVRMLVESHSGWWRFDVIDTGPGVPEDLQEMIFEKCRQGGSNISKDHGGTGLGLALSRSLAQGLGGTLRITSSSAHGTCFSLLLPAAATPSRPDVVTAENTKK